MQNDHVGLEVERAHIHKLGAGDSGEWVKEFLMQIMTRCNLNLSPDGKMGLQVDQLHD